MATRPPKPSGEAPPPQLETVQNLVNISGGPSIDGKAIVLVCTLSDGTTSKFAIPLVDIQLVIGHMLSLAKEASERCSEEDLMAVARPLETINIPITSVALAPGRDEHHEVLVIRVGHINHYFELPTSILTALATRIVRMYGAQE
jgi:hypothetical protein